MLDTPPDLVVISDLHLGSGLDRRGTYSKHEEFFYDHEFESFIRYLMDRSSVSGRTVKLVCNGDIMDFLAVREVPPDKDLAGLGFRLKKSESRYGMGSAETKAVWKTRKILDGHPVFFQALLDFLSAGHHVVFIRGNHDLEFFWSTVKKTIVEHFRDQLATKGQDPEMILTRFEMREWFYYEPERIYIEHGNQYDPTNALTAPLVPLLPEGAYGVGERLLDYPVGSLFARFVYAPVRAIDPYRTHVISFAQYLGVIRGYNLLDFFRTLYFNFPFFLRAVRNSVNFSKEDLAVLMKKQAEARAGYAAENAMTEKMAQEVDQLRSRPLGHSSYQIFMELFQPFLRQVIIFSALAVLSVYGWILIFTSLSTLLSHSIFGRASLMAVLAVLSVVGLFFALTKVGKAIVNYTDPLVPGTRDKAHRAARITAVPLVIMGHTHVAERVTWEDGITYVNSGTWVPMPGPWDHIQPRARQFTFVEVSGLDAKLWRWEPHLGRPVPPVILAEEESTTLARVMGGDFPRVPPE